MNMTCRPSAISKYSLSYRHRFHSRSEPDQKQQLCLCRPAPDRKQQPAPGPPRGKWSRNTSRTLYHNSAWCILLNKAASHILSQNLSSFSLEKLAKAAFLLKGLPASPRIGIRAGFLHRDCRYQASRTFP